LKQSKLKLVTVESVKTQIESLMKVRIIPCPPSPRSRTHATRMFMCCRPPQIYRRKWMSSCRRSHHLLQRLPLPPSYYLRVVGEHTPEFPSTIHQSRGCLSKIHYDTQSNGHYIIPNYTTRVKEISNKRPEARKEQAKRVSPQGNELNDNTIMERSGGVQNGCDMENDMSDEQRTSSAK